MKSKPETETHSQTVAEISRMTAGFFRLQEANARERAAIFASEGYVLPPPAAEVERAEQVRQHALGLLNGFSPDHFKLSRAIPRLQQLELENEALTLVLTALAQKERIARSVEADQAAVEHADEWSTICHDLILDAERFAASEARAIAFRQKYFAGGVPSLLPLAQFVGARSILGINGSGDPLSRAREAALESKIVTQKELKAAQDV